MRILITGASGSGTTTLASHCATQWGWQHVDADDYYWLPTTPPYQQVRNADERLNMILRTLSGAPDSVVSGSVMNWGLSLEDSFDLIVFVYLDARIRVERLRKREQRELGYVDEAFLQWASEYDIGPKTGGRSLERHLRWLDERSCKVIRIEGDLTVEARYELVVEALP